MDNAGEFCEGFIRQMLLQDLTEEATGILLAVAIFAYMHATKSELDMG